MANFGYHYITIPRGSSISKQQFKSAFIHTSPYNFISQDSFSVWAGWICLHKVKLFYYIFFANLQLDNSTVAILAHSTDNIVSIFPYQRTKKREINISLSEWINPLPCHYYSVAYQMCLHKNNGLAGMKTIPLSAWIFSVEVWPSLKRAVQSQYIS